MKCDFYKKILDESLVGYAYYKILCDKSGKPCDFEYIYANKQYQELISISENEAGKKAFSQFVPNYENDNIKLYGNIALNKGRKEYEQYSELLKRWFKILVYSPEKYYFAIIISDMTYEKNRINDSRIEINTEMKYEELLSIINALPSPLFYKNVKGKYLWVNKSFENFYGISNEEMRGKSVFDISPPELAKFYYEKDKELFNNPGVQIYESKISNSNGDILDVIFHKASILNNDKEVIGLIGSILDITDRKKTENELKNSKEKYRLIFEHTPLGVMHFDSRGIVTQCNDKFLEIFGSKKDAVIGLNMLMLPNQKVVSAVRKAIGGNLASYEGSYIPVTGNKNSIVRAVLAPIISKGNNIDGGVGIIEDVTQRTKLQSQLYKEKKLLETTLVSVADSVISTDTEGNIIFINRAAEILTGFTQSEAKEKRFEEVFNTVDELTYKKNINIVNKVLNTGETQEFKNNTILISKDGSERVIESTASPIKEESGNIVGVVLVFRDYTEKRQKQKEIEYLSYHDQLTGLYNRRFYMEELNCMDRSENYPLTVAMGDVNGLKLINDSFGHVMGDMLLKKVSQVLSMVCRKGDIVARLGGDEFVIVMPKTDEEEARKVLDKIKELASKETIGAIGISIPFGYEIKRSENEEIEKVIKKAEDYMYKKKLSESPSIRGNTINAIISALYEKNRREEQHSHRVSELCKKMGIALDMNEYKVEELKTVGLLHDIGKIAIDDNILNKPGKLSSDEWVQIRRHPEIGFRILNTVSDMSDIASYVLFHHERWDGGGYPKHIKGSQIPMESRIIAIADTYDAMTSDRSYRSALPDCIALQELKKNAGFQFDPELVNVFIEKVLKTK